MYVLRLNCLILISSLYFYIFLILVRFFWIHFSNSHQEKCLALWHYKSDLHWKSIDWFLYEVCIAMSKVKHYFYHQCQIIEKLQAQDEFLLSFPLFSISRLNIDCFLFSSKIFGTFQQFLTELLAIFIFNIFAVLEK